MKPKKQNQKIKSRKTKKIRNESYQFTLVNPKKLLRPHPDPKNILIGLQNELKKQKIKKSQKTNKFYKMKVINDKKGVKLTSKCCYTNSTNSTSIDLNSIWL